MNDVTIEVARRDDPETYSWKATPEFAKSSILDYMQAVLCRDLTLTNGDTSGQLTDEQGNAVADWSIHSEHTADMHAIASPELRAEFQARFPDMPLPDDALAIILQGALDYKPVHCPCGNHGGCFKCRPEQWS